MPECPCVRIVYSLVRIINILNRTSEDALFAIIHKRYIDFLLSFYFRFKQIPFFLKFLRPLELSLKCLAFSSSASTFAFVMKDCAIVILTELSSDSVSSVFLLLRMQYIG